MPGQTLIEAHGTWPGAPSSYSYQWEDCSGTGYSCVAISGATGQAYTLQTTDIGHEIRVIETAAYPGGPGIPAISPASTEVMSPVPLYWLYTAYGNVYPGPGTNWYRSPSANGWHTRSIAGLAATADGKGYWEVASSGRVFAFGDALPAKAHRHRYPIIGIVSAPGGGFWLFTAHGNVYRSAATAWYGSPSAFGFRAASITSMAATRDGKGYWLVTKKGRVFSFGDASRFPAIKPAHLVKGIVAAPGGGFWLYTTHGNVYGSLGTPWYRSPAANGFSGSSIEGMAATPDGNGYWLVTSNDAVLAYGDAATLSSPHGGHPIAGIAGG